MGARGKLKLPPHLQAVPDPSQGATAASVVQPLAPGKPASVAESAELSRLWDEVVPQLDADGLLAASDLGTLELALWHLLLARRAAKQVADEGLAIDDARGASKKNPTEAVFRAESAMYLQYAQQLGMTFVSRARTPVTRSSGDGLNPFAASVG